MKEALERAPINSMNVVGELGAQAGLLDAQEIEVYLKNRPDEYAIKQKPTN